MTKKTEYSVKTGILKTVKNMVIMFGPALLAFLASVPIEYTPIASAFAYFLKNYLENKN